MSQMYHRGGSACAAAHLSGVSGCCSTADSGCCDADWRLLSAGMYIIGMYIITYVVRKRREVTACQVRWETKGENSAVITKTAKNSKLHPLFSLGVVRLFVAITSLPSQYQINLYHSLFNRSFYRWFFSFLPRAWPIAVKLFKVKGYKVQLAI